MKSIYSSLLFHMENITVSSNAVDPSFEGYRLFTLDGSVGESALETNAIFKLRLKLI